MCPVQNVLIMGKVKLIKVTDLTEDESILCASQIRPLLLSRRGNYLYPIFLKNCNTQRTNRNKAAFLKEDQTKI
jgi:hypothetical protein